MQNGRQNRSILTLLALQKFLRPESQVSFWLEISGYRAARTAKQQRRLRATPA
jgi:hypothetical protein